MQVCLFLGQVTVVYTAGKLLDKKNVLDVRISIKKLVLIYEHLHICKT